nr:CpXC domain-containing protein [Myxococcota bacterium]
TLHVFRCELCQGVLVVEKDLMYFDFERRQFFCVYPQRERAHERACSQQVKLAFELWMQRHAPAFIVEISRDFLIRVCFGYEELREKIVIDDAGLSDLVIEALKIELLTADPWFEQAGVVTLRLDTLLPDGTLRFVPEWLPGTAPADVELRVAAVTRAVYEEVDARFDDILVHHPGLAAGAHVSLLRLIAWPSLTSTSAGERVG